MARSEEQNRQPARTRPPARRRKKIRRRKQSRQDERNRQAQPQQPEKIRRTPAGAERQDRDMHAPLYDQDEGRMRREGGMPPEETRRHRKKEHRRLTQAEMRRRRIRRRFATAFLVILVVAAGILLSVLLLFKVNRFEIQNMDGTEPANTGVYTEDEIISALGVAKGDNLFSFRLPEKAAALNTAFPLLENAELHRRLPDTLIIRVQPAVESYCIQTDSGWAVLSRYLKVISLSGDQPELPVLTAGITSLPQQGSVIALAPEGANETLAQLLDALESAGLRDSVTAIDLSDPEEITFLYQGRIKVKLGTLNSLDYKMEWSGYILTNENGEGCSETDTGVLDVSHLRSDGTIRPTFAQGDPNAAPTPLPEEEPPASDSAASPAEGDPVPEDGTAPGDGAAPAA